MEYLTFVEELGMLHVDIVGVRDASALHSFRRLLAEYEDGLPPDLRIPDLEMELRTLMQRYPAPQAALLLARDVDRDAGCVVVRPIDAATAEIKRLYVTPAARRGGAARALMAAAIAFARQHEHTRVVLDTDRHRLEPAYRLYRSLGFTECAPYAPADYANPTYMELPLV